MVIVPALKTAAKEVCSVKKKTTFGLLVGTRNIFSSDLAKAGRKALVAKLEKLGYGYVILPEKQTATGSIETYEDAKKCARLFDERKAEIDGVIVVLPNFGDELGVVNTLNLAKLGVPVLVQACDDDLDKVSVAERRDAFCGKLSVCNNLWQYGIPFTDTTTHTCRIDGDAFTRDIEFFSRVCRVVNGVRRARIGAIGARPGAFQTMRYSEKLLQASGITVMTVDLSEIIFAARALADDAAEVAAKLKEIRAYGNIPAAIPDEKVVRQAKLSVAIGNWIAANDIQAAAVQCWTSIQEHYGCATCLTMSMLGEQLVPCACEVDVCGVLAMYALALATGSPSALLDWNNNFGDDRDKCINTHCSAYPKSFMGREVEIANLDVLATVLGADNCFGAVKGNVAPGPMTFFRTSTDDRTGTIRTYLGEGDFTDDPCAMQGGIAVCKVPNLQVLMKHMCKHGYEHHVAMVRGLCADVVEEAVSTYLGWDVYRHRA
ncbi:MAG: fucose isomerase [Kiritimatiellae bacterium]|nr:fucose isomerase [Kiritimatiellia bacterium]